MENKVILPIISIVLGMFLISLVSASIINLTAGETYELELSEVPAYYEITQNTTSIDVNITYNGTKALITPSKYTQFGNFTITFYNIKDEPIYSGGSGGRSSYICYEEWQCGSWSDCINEKQTRICTDSNYCGTTNDKPITSRACSIEEPEETTPTEPSEGFFSRLTGAVVGGITDFAKSRVGIVILGLVIIIILGLVFFRIKRTF